MYTDEKSWDDLVRLLEEETEIYGRMGELLQGEREALLHLEAARLAEICSEKETLGLRIKALDESRKILSERLGRRFAIPCDRLTLSELCRRAPLEKSERLQRARGELRRRAHHCKQLNDYNSRAARRGLDLMNGAIDFLLTEGDPAGKVYEKSGGYGPGRKSPSMISQQV